VVQNKFGGSLGDVLRILEIFQFLDISGAACGSILMQGSPN